MTRLPVFDSERLSIAQTKVYNSILNGPRGKFGGPFTALIHAPQIADKIQSLGESIRFNSKLSPLLREIVVLTIARYWKNEVEWNAHVVIAIKEGVPIQTIKCILFDHPAEAVGEATREQIELVISLCRQLQKNHVIEEPTYLRSVEMLGLEQVVELVSIAGYFTLLSMVLNTFAVEPNSKDGVPPKDLLLSCIFEESTER